MHIPSPIVMNTTSVTRAATASKTASDKATTRALTDRNKKKLQKPLATGEDKTSTIKTTKNSTQTATAKDTGKKEAPRTKTAKATRADKCVDQMKEIAFEALVSIAADAAQLASSASAAAVTVARAAERDRAGNINSRRPSKPGTTNTARNLATAASKPTTTTVVGFGRGTTTTTTAKRAHVPKPATAHTRTSTKVTSSSCTPKTLRPAKNTQDKKTKNKDVTPNRSAAATSNDTKDEFKHVSSTDRKVPTVAPTGSSVHTNGLVEPEVAEPKDTRMAHKETRAKTDTAKEQRKRILSQTQVRARGGEWVGRAIELRDIFVRSSDTEDPGKVNTDPTPARTTGREQQPGTISGRADPSDEVARRTGRQAKVSADSKQEEEMTLGGAAGSSGRTVSVESAVPDGKTSSRVSPPPAVAGRLDQAELRNARALAQTPGSAFRPISNPESPRYFFQSHDPASETGMSHSSTSTSSNRIPVRATSVDPYLEARLQPGYPESTPAPSAHAPDATSTGACAPKPPSHAASAPPNVSFRNSAPIGVPQESVSAAAAPTPPLIAATHSRRDNGVADIRLCSNAGLHERSAKSEEAQRTLVAIPSRRQRDPLRVACDLSSTSSSDAGSAPSPSMQQRDPLRVYLELSSTSSSEAESDAESAPIPSRRQRDPLRVACDLSSTSSSDEGSDVSEVARPHVPLASRRQRDSPHEAVEPSYSDASSVTPNDVAGYRIGGSTAVSPSNALPRTGVRHLSPQPQGPSIAPRHPSVTCGNTTDHSLASSSEEPPVATTTYSAVSSNPSEPKDLVKEPTSTYSAATVARLASPYTHSSVGFDSTAGGVAPPLSAHSAFRRHTSSVPNPTVTTSSIVNSAYEGTDVAEGSLRPSSAAAARIVPRVHNHDELCDGADSRVGLEGIRARAEVIPKKHGLKYGRPCSDGDSRHESSGSDSSDASTISSSGLSCDGTAASDVLDVSNDGDDQRKSRSRHRTRTPFDEEWARDAIARADIFGRRHEEGPPCSDSQHDESEGEMERERKAAGRSSKDKEQQKESHITCGPVCRCTRSCCKSHREKPRMSATRSAAEAQKTAAKATPSPPPQRPSPLPAFLPPPAVSASRAGQATVPAMSTVTLKLLSIQQARNSPSPRPPRLSPMSFHTISRPSSTRALPSDGSQVDPLLDAISPRSFRSVTSASVASGREVCTRPRAPDFRELTWRRGRF